MASSWDPSWGTSWGNSWGANATRKTGGDGGSSARAYHSLTRPEWHQEPQRKPEVRREAAAVEVLKIAALVEVGPRYDDDEEELVLMLLVSA